MNMQDLDQKIIDLIIDITGEEEIGDYRDDDLFEEEVLDSLGAIEVLVALKQHFGVSIAPTELDRDEMNTVNKIIERVKERL
jgi:D-alanine--poly(phosphoribitol) ligase subunit 2